MSLEIITIFGLHLIRTRAEGKPKQQSTLSNKAKREQLRQALFNRNTRLTINNSFATGSKYFFEQKTISKGMHAYAGWFWLENLKRYFMVLADRYQLSEAQCKP